MFREFFLNSPPPFGCDNFINQRQKTKDEGIEANPREAKREGMK